LEVVVHFFDEVGETGDGFDVFVPGLRVKLGEVIGIGNESGGLDDFERINRCRQEDRNERVGIKGDGSDEVFEVGSGAFGA